MSKTDKTKKSQEDLWREILYSSDNDAIKKLLGVLREKGNPKILPDIFKAYKGYHNTKLGEYFYNFLIDLKCKETPEILMGFISNNEFHSIKRSLLSLCWQISLDFSDYFDDFIEIFIKADMKTAFEAFTAIEYLENVDRKVIKSGVEKLQISIDEIGIDKKELLVDLVNVLREKI